jgi:hypothetical protein
MSSTESPDEIVRDVINANLYMVLATADDPGDRGVRRSTSPSWPTRSSTGSRRHTARIHATSRYGPRSAS